MMHVIGCNSWGKEMTQECKRKEEGKQYGVVAKE